MTTASRTLPRTARLTKTDEFSSVFVFRAQAPRDPLRLPPLRTPHLMVYRRQRDVAGGARLGIVVGKKFAPRAVERNRIKRVIREWFRAVRGELAELDLVIRVQTRFARADAPSAAAQRARCRVELAQLLPKLLKARAGGVGEGSAR